MSSGSLERKIAIVTGGATPKILRGQLKLKTCGRHFTCDDAV